VFWRTLDGKKIWSIKIKQGNILDRYF